MASALFSTMTKGLPALAKALRKHPRLATAIGLSSIYPATKGVQLGLNQYEDLKSYIHKKLDENVQARANLKQSYKDRWAAEKKLQDLKKEKKLQDEAKASRAASMSAKSDYADNSLEELKQIETDKKKQKEAIRKSKEKEKAEENEYLESRAASERAKEESNSTSSDSSLTTSNSEQEDRADESIARSQLAEEESNSEQPQNTQQQSEGQGSTEGATQKADQALTLGNFFDYTNPYFQYYTAPTALGLGLGSLLGGWKGGLLGAAGGAGLGALAKYLVDNDKIHMA